MEATAQQQQTLQEKTPLEVIFKNLESPSVVDQFTLPSFQVIRHTARGNIPTTINGVAPFFTIEDLQRTIWLTTKQSNDEFHKYSCLLLEVGENLFSPDLGTFFDEHGT